MPHFVEWYAANKKPYDLRLSWAWKRPLHHANAQAVKIARETKSTHILFIEDDHWGFPVDGLEPLLEAKKEVVGFMTVARKYPYHSLNMNRIDPSLPITQVAVPNMRPFERVSADQDMVMKCDLISWAFTLVEVGVFDKIVDPFTEWGRVPTDSVFCQYCEDANIDRWVHFGYILPHGDIHPDDRFGLIKAHQYKMAITGQSGTELREYPHSAGPVELPTESVTQG